MAFSSDSLPVDSFAAAFPLQPRHHMRQEFGEVEQLQINGQLCQRSDVRFVRLFSSLQFESRTVSLPFSLLETEFHGLEWFRLP